MSREEMDKKSIIPPSDEIWMSYKRDTKQLKRAGGSQKETDRQIK